MSDRYGIPAAAAGLVVTEAGDGLGTLSVTMVFPEGTAPTGPVGRSASFVMGLIRLHNEAVEAEGLLPMRRRDRKAGEGE